MELAERLQPLKDPLLEPFVPQCAQCSNGGTWIHKLTLCDPL